MSDEESKSTNIIVIIPENRLICLLKKYRIEYKKDNFLFQIINNQIKLLPNILNYRSL